MDQNNLRHEYKHAVNPGDYLSLRARLRAVSQLDPHAGQDGTYLIRSLYFDNPYDKVLREKLDGVDNREKFRIRLYNGDDSLILLEKKAKMQGLCQKLSAPITRKECQRILSGDIEWMKSAPNALLVEFYCKLRCLCLRPRTVVDYRREAYIYPPGNVRVTLDSDIRSGLWGRDLFDEALPTLPVGGGSPIILEVKYDAYLPALIADIIQTRERRSAAFSKYAACRLCG